MENMNLLNSIFNFDEIEMVSINKKYIFILVVITVFIILLLIIKKDIYYSGTYTLNGNEILLMVEEKQVNKIKNTNKIIIDNIENSYSINEIVPVNDILVVKIGLELNIQNISNGTYKIYLGKERLFDYIIRIISS